MLVERVSHYNSRLYERLSVAGYSEVTELCRMYYKDNSCEFYSKDLGFFYFLETCYWSAIVHIGTDSTPKAKVVK